MSNLNDIFILFMKMGMECVCRTAPATPGLLIIRLTCIIFNAGLLLAKKDRLIQFSVINPFRFQNKICYKDTQSPNFLISFFQAASGVWGTKLHQVVKSYT